MKTHTKKFKTGDRVVYESKACRHMRYTGTIVDYEPQQMPRVRIDKIGVASLHEDYLRLDK